MLQIRGKYKILDSLPITPFWRLEKKSPTVSKITVDNLKNMRQSLSKKLIRLKVEVDGRVVVMGQPVYYINIIFTELRIYNNNAVILRERERKRVCV